MKYWYLVRASKLTSSFWYSISKKRPDNQPLQKNPVFSLFLNFFRSPAFSCFWKVNLQFFRLKSMEFFRLVHFILSKIAYIRRQKCRHFWAYDGKSFHARFNYFATNFISDRIFRSILNISDSTYTSTYLNFWRKTALQIYTFL